MIPRLAVFLAAVFMATGCKVETDLGKSCTMRRRATPEEEAASGDKAVTLTNADLDTAQDFISFAATECEELVCVRDVSSVEGGPDQPAKGYCSDECILGSTDSCEVTDDSVKPELANRMTCRNLVLDQDALNILIQSDPAKWGPVFGSNRSASFCAGSIVAAP